MVFFKLAGVESEIILVTLDLSLFVPGHSWNDVMIYDMIQPSISYKSVKFVILRSGHALHVHSFPSHTAGSGWGTFINLDGDILEWLGHVLGGSEM